MMRKIVVAVAAVLILAVGAGGGWFVWKHFLRNPVDNARDLIARGEPRGALLVLRNAVRKDPGNAEVHFEMGRLLLSGGDPIAAEKELKEARRAGYKGSELVPLLAESFLAQGKFRDLLRDLSTDGLPPDDAARLLVERSLAQIALRDTLAARASAVIAERMSPSLADAPLALARIAAITGDRGQAMLKVDEALKLDPRKIEALSLKADLQRAEGDLTQAIATLDKAVDVAPQVPTLRLTRARALLIAAEDTRARQDVDVALRAEPKNALALWLQTILLIRAKDWQAANVSMQKLQPYLQQVPRGDYYYALIKFNVGQLEQAMELVSHYVARNKTDPDGHRLIARIKLAMGRSTEAAESLKRASELTGDQAPPAPGAEAPAATPDVSPTVTAEGLTRLAAQQLGSGDATNAERNLQQSLEVQPTRADTSTVQVLSALAAGDIERAEAAMERLARQPKALPEVVGNLTGLVRMARLDFDGATAAWEQAIKDVPTAVPPRVNLARIYSMRGDLPRAEKALSEILEVEPSNRAALRTLVELLTAENKTDEAIKYVRAARKIAPEAIALVVTEAALLARKADFAGAFYVMEQVPLEAALSPTLLTARAQILLVQDKKQEAADAYKQILQNNPGDQTTRGRLVDVLLALDKGEAAQQLVEQGLAQSPGNSTLLQTAVALAYRLKGLDAALALADKLLHDPINLPTARLFKGNLYMAARDFPKAVDAFRAEMQNQPFSGVVISLAGALRAAGKPEEGIRVLQDWVAKQADPTVAEVLSSVDIEAGRYDAAQKGLESVLAVRPNDPIALNNLAWIYAQHGDKRARPLAQKAYLLSPTSQAADTLGWILTNEGDSQLGAALLRRAAQELSNDPSVYYHFAVALKQTGDRANAIAVLKTVLDKGGEFKEREPAKALLAELDTAAKSP